ncbi:EpsG family protein [Pseudomonas sp. Leaf58]|nr:EpsG family protein [Pseudomonas sp. Leaf58]KQN57140.1 hypothetical protein ASF02_26925 [Pseudomonas sp. Leaf58]
MTAALDAQLSLPSGSQTREAKMIFYLCVAMALWLMSAPSIFSLRSTGISLVLGTVLVWSVCALRFETGFDWMVYESYFNAIAQSPFLAQPQDVVAMEPLFYLLNYLIAQIGNFQLFLLVVGTINILSAVYFLQRFDIRVVFGLAYVFCWVFLPLELGTIRQSLAVSALLVCLTLLADGKGKWSVLWFIAAVGFQYSALIYGIVYVRKALRPLMHHAAAVAVVCFVFYCIAPAGIGQATLALGSGLDIPFISEKLAVYADFGGSPRSVAGYGFILFNCALLVATRYTLDYQAPRYVLLVSLLLCLIFAQALLFDFALIWNRVHYLAAFVQAILIYDILATQTMPIRVPAFVLVMALSIAAIGLFLRSPAALLFVPYQSYVSKEWSNTASDGRERTLEYYRMFEASKAQNN